MPRAVPPPQQSTFEQAIDRIQHGLIITTPAGEPVFVNSYARRVLDANSGLRVGRSGLESTRPDHTRTLKQAIERASTGTLERPVTLLLPRQAGCRPLSVHVLAPAAPPPDNCAAVFVCDPDHRPQPTVDLLCRVFALTRAEAAVAILIMQGHTVERAADLLYVSIHTARTHLKRILLKTETNRQGELIRLLLVSCAQLVIE